MAQGPEQGLSIAGPGMDNISFLRALEHPGIVRRKEFGRTQGL